MSNARAALLMVLAMAGFAVEDVFVKHLSARIPVGEILMMLGLFGGAVFGASLALKRQKLLSRNLLDPLVVARNLSELVGTFGYVLAVALTPLSSASAIIQAIPLVVTMAAALILGEQVGWRRWMAIGLGALGVLLVLKPGLDGFRPASLFAVVAVIGLAARDLITRRMRKDIPAEQLSASAFYAVAALGAAMVLARPQAAVIPTPLELALLFVGGGFGILGYVALVSATRHGTVAAIAPFRYSRLVFGMAMGIIFFGERPDMLTYVGSALIVSAGIYSLWRESVLKRASPN